MLQKVSRRVICTVIVLSLVFTGSFTTSKKASAAGPASTVIVGVNDDSKLINLSGDSILNVSGLNTIGAIACSGDLTIVGSNNAKLIVKNTSYTSQHMADNPGIVANGSITIKNVSIEDYSRGTAIADVSGSKGGISIKDSTVTIRNAGFKRLYGIRSIAGLSIDNSTINISAGYKEAGLFAFERLSLSNSTTYVENDGKYSIVSTSDLFLNRGQKISTPADASVDQVTDTEMFPNGKVIETIVTNNKLIPSSVSIIQTVPYDVVVSGGSASYPNGYEGEEIGLTAIVPEGKAFVKWKAPSDVDIKSVESETTSFKMPGHEVNIEAVFKAAPKPTSSFVTGSNVPHSSSSTKPTSSSERSSGGGSVSSGSSGGSSGGGSTSSSGEGAVLPSASPSVITEDTETNIILPTLTPTVPEFVENDNSAVTEIDENTVTVTETDNKGNKTTITLTESTLSYQKVSNSGSCTTADYAITGEDKISLVGFVTTSDTITVPNTIEVDGEIYKVVSIKASAFSKNSSIKKITIGKNITSIDPKAFDKCINLTTIVITSNIKSIGSKAFKNISNKAVIYIKASFKQFRNLKKKIKSSGVANTTRFKRI